jgi:hypothetical protein
MDINEKHLVLTFIIIILIYLIYCQNKKKEHFQDRLAYVDNLTKEELQKEKERICKITPTELANEYYHERELENCTW